MPARSRTANVKQVRVDHLEKRASDVESELETLKDTSFGVVGAAAVEAASRKPVSAMTTKLGGEARGLLLPDGGGWCEDEEACLQSATESIRWDVSECESDPTHFNNL